MIKVFLIIGGFEILKLWHLGLSVIDATIILCSLLLLSLPISMSILRIGRYKITNDYDGTKLKLLLLLSMLWIVSSIYIINHNIKEILEYVHAIMQ